MSTADFDELLAILDLTQIDDDRFIGAHPSKNPVRTFGGQMMAQSFVAASRSLTHDVPPSALSVHFIAGGDPQTRISSSTLCGCATSAASPTVASTCMQDGQLLTTAMVSFLSGGRSLEHGIEPPELPGSAVRAAGR